MSHPYQNIWGDPKLGEDCNIAAFVEIGRDVIIGDRVMIEAFSFIPPGITIEDDVFIGPHVVFTNDKNPPSNYWGNTIIRRRVSIGANCTILPDIEIGEGAMIGAGSVVTKNVPPGETWVGSPAKKIERTDSLKTMNDMVG